MLSMTRYYHDGYVEALMISREVLDQPAERTVKESIKARLPDAHALTDLEEGLFAFLEARENGRLEQEFLSAETVSDALYSWFHR